jgi:hypothetical protein
MVLIIVNEWFVNSDKTVTFYDEQKFKDYLTGNTKQVLSEEEKRVRNKKTGEVTYDKVVLTKHEHRFDPSGYTFSESNQVTGYQFFKKSTRNSPEVRLLLPLGRRQMENKKPVQKLEEIEVLFGLREPEVEAQVEPELEAQVEVEPEAQPEA